jgi:bifunctional non-homologous end joining protein LigD
MAKSVTKRNSGKGSKKRVATSPNSNWPFVESQPQTDKTEIMLDNCPVELFSVDRPIWKNVTKADLIAYYHDVHEFILPHLHERPLSLHFKLNGPTSPGKYIKDLEGRRPPCAEVFRDRRRHVAQGKRNIIDYLVCNHEAILLWLINWGCIDVNPWNSRRASPDHPDWIVIDLDPSEESLSAKGLKRLRHTAMAAAAYFEEQSLKAFAKTSGKTGLHFLVPCSGFLTTQARALGEEICAGVHAMVPDDSTITVSKNQRAGKVFVDFSQNDYADTIAAVYSVRPFTRPLVSTPLAMKEINDELDPRAFTMDVVRKRLQKNGDLWVKILDKKIANANNKVLRKLMG